MAYSARPPLDMLNLPQDEKERLRNETRGPAAYYIMFTFYALTVVFVSLRLYVRLRISRHAGVDDWLIIPSELTCTVMIVFIYYQIHYGSGRHLLALTLEATEQIARHNFVAVTMWIISITFTKASILVQYMRFLPSPETTRLIWALMVVVVLSGISSFVVIMTACIPLHALWNFTAGQTAKCLNQLLFWQVQCVVETLTCWLMLCLLVPSLWKLQLPREQRLGIIILLGMSSSSCIASALRLRTSFVSIPKNPKVVGDFTYNGIMATIYAVVELTTGIICCSLPALMPLRFILCPRLFPRTRRISSPVQQRPPRPIPEQAIQIARPMLPTPSMTRLTAASPRRMFQWTSRRGSVSTTDRTWSVDTEATAPQHSQAPHTILEAPAILEAPTLPNQEKQREMTQDEIKACESGSPLPWRCDP